MSESKFVQDKIGKGKGQKLLEFIVCVSCFHEIISKQYSELAVFILRSKEKLKVQQDDITGYKTRKWLSRPHVKHKIMILCCHIIKDVLTLRRGLDIMYSYQHINNLTKENSDKCQTNRTKSSPQNFGNKAITPISFYFLSFESLIILNYINRILPKTPVAEKISKGYYHFA